MNKNEASAPPSGVEGSRVKGLGSWQFFDAAPKRCDRVLFKVAGLSEQNIKFSWGFRIQD